MRGLKIGGGAAPLHAVARTQLDEDRPEQLPRVHVARQTDEAMDGEETPSRQIELEPPEVPLRFRAEVRGQVRLMNEEDRIGGACRLVAVPQNHAPLAADGAERNVVRFVAALPEVAVGRVRLHPPDPVQSHAPNIRRPEGAREQVDHVAFPKSAFPFAVAHGPAHYRIAIDPSQGSPESRRRRSMHPHAYPEEKLDRSIRACRCATS